MVDKKSKAPKIVINQIRAAILDGLYGPGDRLLDLAAVPVVVRPSRMTWRPVEAVPRAAMVVGIAPVVWSPLPEIAASRAYCRGGKQGN